MDTNLPLIGTIALCLALSAYFSATETAFSSVNKVRLKTMAHNGNKRAALTLQLTDNYDQLLTTILVGNNIVNIAAASVGTVLFTNLVGNYGPTLSTVVMTVLVLIFSEISPKSLAKEMPERFAMATAPLTHGLVKIFRPINYVFTLWKRFLSRMVKPSTDRGAIVEDELMTMVDEAQHDGDMDAREGELIRSAIEFPDQAAGDILTPRVDVTALEDDTSMDEAAQVFRETGYSRLPVYHETIDHIIGILHEKDFYSALHEGATDITLVMKPAVYAPASLEISKLLQLLQARKTHLIVVLDEFGGTEGIATLEDVLEELVGEIYDEHDDVTIDVQALPDGSLMVDGSVDLEDLLEQLNIDKEYEADTVGGWIAEVVGHIPQVGEEILVDGVKVTVLAMDKRRVQKVKVAERSFCDARSIAI